jgi:hypothetical protein
MYTARPNPFAFHHDVDALSILCEPVAVAVNLLEYELLILQNDCDTRARRSRAG